MSNFLLICIQRHDTKTDKGKPNSFQFTMFPVILTPFVFVDTNSRSMCAYLVFHKIWMNIVLIS